jgi:hypothetical protein
MCDVVQCWRLFDTRGIPDKCLIDQWCRDAFCSGTGQIRLQFSPSPLRDDDDADQGDDGQTVEEEPHIYGSLQMTQEISHWMLSVSTAEIFRNKDRWVCARKGDLLVKSLTSQSIVTHLPTKIWNPSYAPGFFVTCEVEMASLNSPWNTWNSWPVPHSWKYRLLL